MKARISRVVYNRSLCDGPGVRTLVFFQGCDVHCKGCQNPSTWDPAKGTEIEISELADELEANSFNNKVTITGGEPLLQKEAVAELAETLDDRGFDVALYTGHSRNDVPESVMRHIKYLKSGPFVESLKSTVIPFMGSQNQKFERIKK